MAYLFYTISFFFLVVATGVYTIPGSHRPLD